MNLGENIYRFRTERNMSQGDLADALEVSRQSVSKWENNSATPELDKLLKMSELFGVTLDQLVGKEAPVSPTPEPAPREIHVHQSAPVHRTLGVILLCVGLAAFLALTLLNSVLPGIFLGLPLIVVGCVCIVCNENLVFKSAWALFATVAPILILFLTNYVFRFRFLILAIYLPVLLWFLILVAVTVLGLRSGRLSAGSKRTAIVCVILATLFTVGLSIAIEHPLFPF